MFVLPLAPCTLAKVSFPRALSGRDAADSSLGAKGSYLGWKGPHSTAQQFVRMLLWL